MRLAYLLISLSWSLVLQGQGEADIWVTGYNYNFNEPEDTIYGTTIWDFSSDTPEFIYTPTLSLDYLETNATISTSEGSLLLMTNGMEISDFNNLRIADTIGYLGEDFWWENFSNTEGMFLFGFPITQGALILPVPGKQNEYSVIYPKLIYDDINGHFAPTLLLEAQVRIEEGQEGELIYKDSIVLSHEYLGYGKFTACRHGNGRDWWILVADADSPNYFRLLLDPEGLRLDGIQDTEVFVADGVGQSWFSPDGQWYAKYEGYTFSSDYVLSLYRFDRCSGLLTPQEQISVPHEELSAFGGMCFSPDSRHIYANTNWELYQWDLQSEDIPGSKTYIDTFDGFVEPDWFITPFSFMHTAPDGRIYMITNSASSRYVHVIDRPNEAGPGCKLKQHSLRLPTWNGRSTPNYANYRLGPLDGSPCDTLGLDNHPVAKWRHEPEEEEEPKVIRFTDLSYFRPEQWHWDFDDGSTSSEKNPIHSYAQSGLYHVCLTVSNEYASDSTCHWVEILSTAAEALRKSMEVLVSPNPFSEEIVIRPGRSYRNFRISLYDARGRLVVRTELPCHCSIDTRHLPAGVYFYSIEEDGATVKSGKLMKVGE